MIHLSYYKIVHNKIVIAMFDLFQERRVFVNSKRNKFAKNLLPQIKYSPLLPKKMNDDILIISNNNSKIIYNYQPLSNILISKKIAPPNPQQGTLLISKKRPTHNMNIHNFKLRKQSQKKHTDNERQQSHQQTNRNSTSLSHRIWANAQKRIQQSMMEQINKVKASEQLTFIVVKGNNNEELVRQILNDRKIWKQIKYGEGIPNFKWVFYKDKHNYKKMNSYTKKKIINHFQFNEEITTKDSLIKNLQIYCQTKKIQVFTITPITFIIDFDDQYCDYNIKQFLNFFQRNDPRKTNAKKQIFPHNFMMKFQPYMAWQNSDIKKKVNILSKPVNNSTYYSQNSYLWLLKPTGLNRGRGIQIFDSLEQLQKILLDFLIQMNRKKLKEKPVQKQKHHKQIGRQQKQKGQKSVKQLQKKSLSKQIIHRQSYDLQISTNMTNQSKLMVEKQKFKLNTCSFVIQKYVQKPLLLNQRKFDIRVWTLLTQSMNVYFFKEGYIRTSAEVYSTNNIENYFIHLTNNAIQKHSQNYGQFENANQLSFWNLKDYIPQQEVQKIWNRIKEITFMTFSSIKKKINANQRKHCFQIFGLDFFIDAQLKVWLIEVNQNPCIECSSPLLGKLIPRMIHDAFKLTLDVIIDKKIQQKAYPVDGYSDGEVMWQKLGQLIPNGSYSPKKI